MTRAGFIILAALAVFLLGIEARAQDIRTGYGGIAWNTPCGTAFSGQYWVEDNSRVSYDQKSKDLAVIYGEKGGKYTNFRFTNYKSTPDPLGILDTLWGCEKESGKFKAVTIRFSVLKYKKVKNFLYAQLGEHTKKYGYIRTWDLDDIYAQINQTLAVIVYKK